MKLLVGNFLLMDGSQSLILHSEVIAPILNLPYVWDPMVEIVLQYFVTYLVDNIILQLNINNKHNSRFNHVFV